MLYFETVCSLIHDIPTNFASRNICRFLTYLSDIMLDFMMPVIAVLINQD